MIKMVRIGMDIDGVVANFGKSFLNYLNHKLDRNIVQSSNLYFYKDYDVPKKLVENLYQEYVDLKGLLTIEPYKDAKLLLNKLAGSGVSLFYVTARPRITADDTYQWFIKNDIPLFQGIIFAKDKNEIVKQLSIDMFVDDFPVNLYKNPAKLKFLKHHPYNNYFNEKKYGIERVYNLKSALLNYVR